jgi:hypothetical protein
MAGHICAILAPHGDVDADETPGLLDQYGAEWTVRVDSSHTNYNGGVRSTGFSTGVTKKELGIANLMVEKAAKLDCDTFGVAVGQGPWQRRLEEIGGIKPLAFGEFGEMGPGRPRSSPCWHGETRGG